MSLSASQVAGGATTARDMNRPVEQSPAVGLAAALTIGGLPAIVLAVIATKFGGMNNPWMLPLAVMTFCANTMIILMDVRYGLALFILGAALSPKLPGNLRVEDFIFIHLFLTFIMKSLRAGKFPDVPASIKLPFLILTVMSIASTLWGMSIGQVKDIPYSLFLQLKRVEYYLIFWVVASTVRSETWVRLLFLTFVASGALAGLYGFANRQEDYSGAVTQKRVTGPEGENYNTLCGYLIICIGAGLAALPQFRRSIPRGIILGAVIICTAALLASFSREGYIMLAGSLLVFGVTKHRMILILALMALVIAFVAVEPVREHVFNTAETIQTADKADSGSNSLTARYRAWSDRWNGWFIKQPFIGNGVGSVALTVDNEYLLRLCEVGLLGFAVFVWWLSAMGGMVIKLQKSSGLPQALALGLGAAFAGLLIQGMAAAAFNTIRTMEPFFYLLGLVTAAVALQRRHVVRPPVSPVPPAVHAGAL